MTPSRRAMLKCVDVVLHHCLAMWEIDDISFMISRFLWPPPWKSLNAVCAIAPIRMLDLVWASSCSRAEARTPWPSLTNYLRSDPDYYQLQFSDSMSVAVDRGDVAIVQWLLAHFVDREVPIRTVTSGLIVKAAKGGHLRILQALWEHRSSNQHNGRCDSTIDDDSFVKQWCSGGFCNAEHCKDIAIKEAVQNGEFTHCLNDEIHFVRDDLQIATKQALNVGDFELAERLLPPGHCVLDFADDCHHPDIILEMFERDHFRWNAGRAATAMSDLAKSGHLQLMQQLFQLHSPLQENHHAWERAWCDALGSACSSGNLSVVQWLAGHPLCRENMERCLPSWAGLRGRLFCAAVEAGHIEILQYLYDQLSVPQVDRNVLRVSIQNDRARSIRWIVDHNLLTNQEQFGDAVMIALEWGRLEILQILHSLTLTQHDAELERRQAGPTVLKPLAFEKGSGCGMFFCAAKSGNAAVLEWLHANHVPAKCKADYAMDIAASMGHLAAVQWLHVNRGETCTRDAMAWAAQNGHFKMVKWLYTNRPGSRTDAAIAAAIRNGHLQIANWLVPKFPNFKVLSWRRYIFGTDCGFATKLESILFVRTMYPSQCTPTLWQSLRDIHSNPMWGQISPIVLGWISRNCPQEHDDSG